MTFNEKIAEYKDHLEALKEIDSLEVYQWLISLGKQLSNTIFSSRQLINHGHVRVNGKKVNISSYQVKEEDSIEIRDKSKQLALIDIALANKERDVPEYLQLDEKNKKVKFVRIPKFEEVPYPVVMEPNLVIEYYSR